MFPGRAAISSFSPWPSTLYFHFDGVPFIWELAFSSLWWLKSFMTGGFLLNQFLNYFPTAECYYGVLSQSKASGRLWGCGSGQGSGDFPGMVLVRFYRKVFQHNPLAVAISPEFIFGVGLEPRSKIHALGSGVLCCERPSTAFGGDDCLS